MDPYSFELPDPSLFVLSIRTVPYILQYAVFPSVADPGSGAFLTPGSWIWNMFFLDPGSQTHIFEMLMTIFCKKVPVLYLCNGQVLSAPVQK
jgi:hypothetical protein